jgi:hypothetical protein
MRRFVAAAILVVTIPAKANVSVAVVDRPPTISVPDAFRLVEAQACFKVSRFASYALPTNDTLGAIGGFTCSGAGFSSSYVYDPDQHVYALLPPATATTSPLGEAQALEQAIANAVARAEHLHPRDVRKNLLNCEQLRTRTIAIAGYLCGNDVVPIVYDASDAHDESAHVRATLPFGLSQDEKERRIAALLPKDPLPAPESWRSSGPSRSYWPAALSHEEVALRFRTEKFGTCHALPANGAIRARWVDTSFDPPIVGLLCSGDSSFTYSDAVYEYDGRSSSYVTVPAIEANDDYHIIERFGYPLTPGTVPVPTLDRVTDLQPPTWRTYVPVRNGSGGWEMRLPISTGSVIAVVLLGIVLLMFVSRMFGRKDDALARQELKAAERTSEREHELAVLRLQTQERERERQFAEEAPLRERLRMQAEIQEQFDAVKNRITKKE